MRKKNIKSNKKKLNSKKNVKKIPFLWRHLAITRQDITTFWKSFFGVVALYGFIYAVTVVGLNFIVPQFANETTTTGVLESEKNPDAVTRTFDSISQAVSFVGGDQSSTLVQFLLFLLGSLAFIWALRKVRKLKNVKVSEAYYQGSAQIVALFLLSIILILFLVPASLGVTVLGSGLLLATSLIEKIIIFIIFALLTFLSLWLYAIYWPSFYIVSLPGMRPLYSLKQAAQLTKGHRFNISAQVFGYVLLVIISLVLLILPVALLMPPVTPYWLYVLLFVIFAFSHAFLFSIYRSLLDEQ